MEIVEVRWGLALVLQFKGRLDVSNSASTQERLLSYVEKGYIYLALDLSPLEYISSSGLRVLLTTLRKIKDCKGKIVLFGLSSYLKTIFDIVGLSTLFPICVSAEEALDAFRWRHPLSQFIQAPRHGPNAGAYCGETIDIDSLQEEILRAARETGWVIEPLLEDKQSRLFALSRLSPSASRSVYLSGGLHGDEPAPPLAMASLLEQNQWPDDCNIYLCPCLNPEGFRANSRSNSELVDLNRDYSASKSKEIRAHVAWLERQPGFSLAASLHEDWEATGFYVYQLGPLPVRPVIQHILDHVGRVCPIDGSPIIDHLPADEGVLDLAFHSLQVNEALIDGLDEHSVGTVAVTQPCSIWSEPIFLVNRKTRVSYTFEAPSALPLEVRVQALTEAVGALLSCLDEVY